MEYLPAIGEALTLLYEREQAFHARCASLRVDCSGEFVSTEYAEVESFLKANEAYLKKVAAMGAEKARASAATTIREIREIIGFKSL